MLTQDGLVFGERGFLGRSIRKVLGIPGTDADICSSKEIAAVLGERMPAYCINAAGIRGKPNTSDCDSTPEKRERTLRVNGDGPGVLAAICARRGIHLTHLSSGSVYETTPAASNGFTEDMPPTIDPKRISTYALSKWHGERILAEHPNALIVRLHMPASTILHGGNLLTRMAGYPTVIDVSNTIVVVSDLIAALEKLIAQRITGIVHVVNPEPIRNARIIELYREFRDRSHHFTVVPPSASSRPPAVLNTDKLRSLGVVMRPTEEALLDCIKRYAIVK